MADLIVAVEIEFTREGEIRGDYQVTGTAQDGIMNIDVILLDRFVAFVKELVFPSFFADKISGSHSPDIFFIRDDAKHMVAFIGKRGCLILRAKKPGSGGRCEKRQVAKWMRQKIPTH